MHLKTHRSPDFIYIHYWPALGLCLLIPSSQDSFPLTCDLLWTAVACRKVKRKGHASFLHHQYFNAEHTLHSLLFMSKVKHAVGFTVPSLFHWLSCPGCKNGALFADVKAFVALINMQDPTDGPQGRGPNT